MSQFTSDYDYPLQEELIAREPLPRREDSRMMVLRRSEKSIAHLRFADFPSFIERGDLVVLNDTRVVPARIFSDDGRVEFLFLESTIPHFWKCLVKPGRRMRLGASVVVQGRTGKVREILPDGERMIEFEGPIDLEKFGQLPLPPYLKREAEPIDLDRYQTVFAREPGAVAAPTAGLHFNSSILARVPHTFLTLHVGPGTFRPVQTELLADHRMHAERFRISAETAQAVNDAKRVLAIGTTTTRVLETCSLPLKPTEGISDVFIHPPYEFQVVDGLLTNFHLPRTTLLMLVSAFAGREFVLRAYAEAIRKKYRFYSYGDCMLIL